MGREPGPVPAGLLAQVQTDSAWLILGKCLGRKLGFLRPGRMVEPEGRGRDREGVLVAEMRDGGYGGLDSGTTAYLSFVTVCSLLVVLIFARFSSSWCADAGVSRRGEEEACVRQHHRSCKGTSTAMFDVM